MTEMLGVLAIIGILSLAALIGYRFAVDKYLANDTLDEVNSRAVITMTQLSRGLISLRQDEFDSSTRHGYAVETDFLTDAEGFYIQLDAVPKGVCKQLAASNYIHAMSINNIADTVDGNLCIDMNTIRFTFKTEITQCRNDTDCVCGTCIDGQCTSDCPNGTACASDYSTGIMTCCPYNKLANGLCCNSINEDGLCCDDKGSCCPADKPLINNNSQCVSCDGPQSINVTNYQDTCTRCPNRALIRDNYGKSWLCAKKCPTSKPIMDTKGVCHACSDSGYEIDDDVASIVSAAYECPKTLLSHANPNVAKVGNCDDSAEAVKVIQYTDMCSKCDNRVLTNVYNQSRCALKCSENKPIMDENGKCRSCDESNYRASISLNEAAVRACPYSLMKYDNPDVMTVYNCYDTASNLLLINVVDYSELCAKCPNRMVSGRYCTFKDCPDGYIRSSNDLCESCSNSKISIPYASECAKCPGKEVLVGINSLSCADPTCPDGKFRDVTGTCWDCDLNDSRQIAKASDCTVCPNRVTQGTACLPECRNNSIKEGNTCVCPSDKPLMSWSGNCTTCGNEVEVWSKEACEVCPEMVHAGSACRNKCPADTINNDGVCTCPSDRPLMDMGGKCYSCNVLGEINVYANVSACNVCDGSNGQAKRKLKLGSTYPYCILAN